jgi:uncharacterized protein involved in outer membrane biogenesis
LKIANPSSKVEPVLLEAQKLQVGYSFAALFNREIAISNFRIQQPMISLHQSAGSGIVLPFKLKDAQQARLNKPAFGLPSGWKISFKSIEFQDAVVEIKNDERKVLLRLTGVGLLAGMNSVVPQLTGSGTLHIDNVKLGSLLFSSLNSSMVIGNNTLTLPNLQATAYLGQLTGNFEMSLTGPAYPYTLKLDGNGIDMNQMLTAQGRPSYLSGKLTIKTSWRGPLNDPDSIVGKGTADIINGQMITVPFWKLLAQTPGLGQLAQPDFSQMSTAFDLTSQSLLISVFSVKSALAELSGTGSATLDKALDLQVRLSMSPELAKQLPPNTDDKLTRRVDGYREVAFSVKGTQDNPEIDLAQKLGLATGFSVFMPTAKPPALAPTPTPALTEETKAPETTPTPTAKPPEPTPAATPDSTSNQ